MNFLFFYTILQNEKLLIAWVKHHYPQYNLSFSAPGWVTFKAPSPESLVKDLKSMSCPLALRWGFGLDVIKHSENLYVILERLCEQYQVTNLHFWNSSINLEIPQVQLNKPLTSPTKCLHLYQIKENHFVTGLTLQTDFQSPAVGAKTINSIPELCPSRAYLKLAQLHSHYNFKWKLADIVLELGASPGGITTFLLEQGLEVHAVDSAPLKITHPKLKIIIDSVQRITPEDLASNTKWIMSDLNLNPEQVIREIIRLGSHLNSLEGLIITIKLPKIEMIKKLELYLKLLRDNFKTMKFSLFQVPSHKQETHIVGTILRQNHRA